MEFKEVGNIGNYYGGLNVGKHNGKYYWCIENYTTDLADPKDDSWQEITKQAYDFLLTSSSFEIYPS